MQNFTNDNNTPIYVMNAHDFDEALRSPNNPLSKDYIAACVKIATEQEVSKQTLLQQHQQIKNKKQQEEVEESIQSEKEIARRKKASEINSSNTHAPMPKPTPSTTVLTATMIKLAQAVQNLQTIQNQIVNVQQQQAALVQQNQVITQQLVNITYNVPQGTTFRSTVQNEQNQFIDVTVNEGFDLTVSEETKEEILNTPMLTGFDVLQKLPVNHPARVLFERERERLITEKTQQAIDNGQDINEQTKTILSEATKEAMRIVINAPNNRAEIKFNVRIANDFKEHDFFKSKKIGINAILRMLKEHSQIKGLVEQITQNMSLMENLSLEGSVLVHLQMLQQNLIEQLVAKINPDQQINQNKNKFYSLQNSPFLLFPVVSGNRDRDVDHDESMNYPIKNR